MLFFSIEELSLRFPFESWESKDGCNQERVVGSCAKDFLRLSPPITPTVLLLTGILRFRAWGS